MADKRYVTTEFDMKVKLVNSVEPEIAAKIDERCKFESPGFSWSMLVEKAIKYERISTLQSQRSTLASMA